MSVRLNLCCFCFTQMFFVSTMMLSVAVYRCTLTIECFLVKHNLFIVSLIGVLSLMQYNKGLEETRDLFFNFNWKSLKKYFSASKIFPYIYYNGIIIYLLSHLDLKTMLTEIFYDYTDFNHSHWLYKITKCADVEDINRINEACVYGPRSGWKLLELQ